jgi:hypothetical protein
MLRKHFNFGMHFCCIYFSRQACTSKNTRSHQRATGPGRTPHFPHAWAVARPARLPSTALVGHGKGLPRSLILLAAEVPGYSVVAVSPLPLLSV